MELWILWMMIVLPSGQTLVHEGTHDFSSSEKCQEFGQPMADILVTVFPKADVTLFCRPKDRQRI